jgi:hypothetical protein
MKRHVVFGPSRLVHWCLAGVGGLLCSLGGCADQPEPRCATTLNTFAAKYELVSGTGACAELPGEVLGAMTFVVDPRDPGDGLFSLAIQSAGVGDLIAAGEAADPAVQDTDATHHPYGFGKFTEKTPSGDGVCRVSSFTPAQLDLAEIPAPPVEPPEPPGDAIPATQIGYQWSNLRLAVSAASHGNEWAADLSYTRDGCTAQYRVHAVAPAVSCDDGSGTADPSLCAREAAIAQGVHPSLASRLSCDEGLLSCVLADEPEF